MYSVVPYFVCQLYGTSGYNFFLLNKKGVHKARLDSFCNFLLMFISTSLKGSPFYVATFYYQGIL